MKVSTWRTRRVVSLKEGRGKRRRVKGFSFVDRKTYYNSRFLLAEGRHLGQRLRVLAPVRAKADHPRDGQLNGGHALRGAFRVEAVQEV